MRPIRIQTLSPEQLDALEELYLTTREARLRTRAQMVLLAYVAHVMAKFDEGDGALKWRPLVAEPTDRKDGDLRVHRGLLQHPQKALRALTPQPFRVRGG
jgi:hypothetical protein